MSGGPRDPPQLAGDIKSRDISLTHVSGQYFSLGVPLEQWD